LRETFCDASCVFSYARGAQSMESGTVNGAKQQLRTVVLLRIATLVLYYPRRGYLFIIFFIPIMLKVGKKAPAFSLLDQTEQKHSLKQYVGQWTLIYFYPKDDTPGCTKEACMIADVYKDFKRLKVAVLGVSKDTPKSHQKFAQKYNLPFTLLSDPEMAMITKYGALKEKSMFGKPVRGTLRISYLIAPDGTIARVYPEVDPATHALELLKDIKVLQKEAKKQQG
jgi:thioredoxin-dependent peroxiredoxin